MPGTALLQYATFPGVNSVISCSYTCSHGTSPSVAVLEIVPQPNVIAAGGSLVFFFDGFTLTIPNCKVDQASLRYDAQGFVWSLSIFDRRWRWAFGEVSGSWNE